VEPGQVRFEFKDYAFRSPEAVRAAEAAACAEDQGAYWHFHDTLFLNQEGPGSFTDARLKQMAQVLGLDTEAFNSCLDSGEKRADVEQSLASGNEQGVDSTPTIFVDGVQVPWQGWDSLDQAIAASLTQG
jgi:protein-disulfide isomerase